MGGGGVACAGAALEATPMAPSAPVEVVRELLEGVNVQVNSDFTGKTQARKGTHAAGVPVPVVLWDPGVCRPVAPPVPAPVAPELLEGVGVATGDGGGEAVTLFTHWPTPLHDVPLGQICTHPAGRLISRLALSCIALC